MNDKTETANQLNLLLRAPNQVWFLGAGASHESGLPLMSELTKRVIKKADVPKDLLRHVNYSSKGDINIEHILDHINDIISIIDRTKKKTVLLNGSRFYKEKLTGIQDRILEKIQETLKWGYESAQEKLGEVEKIGTKGNPITKIHFHHEFVDALFNINRAGLEEQHGAIQLVTTNYDTLLEDALALEKIPYTDGLTGGAIASWSEHNYKQSTQLGAEAKKMVVLTKLHGSIDWYRSKSNGQIYRFRHEDKYPDREEAGSVVIYPQASKHELAHRLPFAALFQNFRQILSNPQQKVLFTCGYSFGDDHINAIIEDCLLDHDNNLTLVALTKDIPSKVKAWVDKDIRERIYLLTDSAIFRGQDRHYFEKVTKVYEWWTFAGAIDLLRNGLSPEIEKDLVNEGF